MSIVRHQVCDFEECFFLDLRVLFLRRLALMVSPGMQRMNDRDGTVKIFSAENKQMRLNCEYAKWTEIAWVTSLEH